MPTNRRTQRPACPPPSVAVFCLAWQRCLSGNSVCQPRLRPLGVPAGRPQRPLRQLPGWPAPGHWLLRQAEACLPCARFGQLLQCNLSPSDASVGRAGLTRPAGGPAARRLLDRIVALPPGAEMRPPPSHPARPPFLPSPDPPPHPIPHESNCLTDAPAPPRPSPRFPLIQIYATHPSPKTPPRVSS